MHKLLCFALVWHPNTLQRLLLFWCFIDAGVILVSFLIISKVTQLTIIEVCVLPSRARVFCHYHWHLPAYVLRLQSLRPLQLPQGSQPRYRKPPPPHFSCHSAITNIHNRMKHNRFNLPKPSQQESCCCVSFIASFDKFNAEVSTSLYSYHLVTSLYARGQGEKVQFLLVANGNQPSDRNSVLQYYKYEHDSTTFIW